MIKLPPRLPPVLKAAYVRPTWQEKLIYAGYPPDVLVLDFETFFVTGTGQYNLKELSTPEYIADKRFEILGLAARWDDCPAFWHRGLEATRNYLDTVRAKCGERLERCTVVIQNAPFDASILARVFGIYPKYVIDLIGLDRYQNARQSHKLADMCPRYGVPVKGDTAEFDGASFRTRFRLHKGNQAKKKPPIMVPPMSSDTAAKLAAYALNDAEREWDLFQILLPLQDNVKTELSLQQHTLELFTRPTLIFDDAKAGEIQDAMKVEMAKAIPEGVTAEQLSGDNDFSSLLEHALVRAGDFPPEYMKPVKTPPGKPLKKKFALAADDPERKLLLEHKDDEVRRLVGGRLAIKSWPLHIGKLESLRSMAASCSGLFTVPLKYYGAHTGRWSGDEGVNPQNMGSKSHPLINQVRECLVAPEGKSLVIVDASQVEARGTAWFAGEQSLLDRFRNNEEIYCGFASKVLGYPVRKARKGGIPAVEQKMKWARDSIGKVGVLGCGYGMGTNRIQEYAKGEVDYETAERIKTVYREENKRIVAFWYDIEKAFRHVAKYARPTVLGFLAFDSTERCHVRIRLPNGRFLHYPKVRIVREERGDHLEVYNEKLHTWEHTWGGSLTENVVQAMCRDLLAENILSIEECGLHVCFHCHDEVVICVDDNRAIACKDFVERLMAKTPEWAPGLPLGAEGRVSKRYCK